MYVCVCVYIYACIHYRRRKKGGDHRERVRWSNISSVETRTPPVNVYDIQAPYLAPYCISILYTFITLAKKINKEGSPDLQCSVRFSFG